MTFRIFYDHLVHFLFIWYIFSCFGIMYQEKSGNPGWYCEIDGQAWNENDLIYGKLRPEKKLLEKSKFTGSKRSWHLWKNTASKSNSFLQNNRNKSLLIQIYQLLKLPLEKCFQIPSNCRPQGNVFLTGTYVNDVLSLMTACCVQEKKHRLVSFFLQII
jgi:hypothetical protein